MKFFVEKRDYTHTLFRKMEDLRETLSSYKVKTKWGYEIWI
jgi:hypothetical protein